MDQRCQFQGNRYRRALGIHYSPRKRSSRKVSSTPECVQTDSRENKSYCQSVAVRRSKAPSRNRPTKFRTKRYIARTPDRPSQSWLPPLHQAIEPSISETQPVREATAQSPQSRPGSPAIQLHNETREVRKMIEVTNAPPDSGRSRWLSGM